MKKLIAVPVEFVPPVKALDRRMTHSGGKGPLTLFGQDVNGFELSVGGLPPVITKQMGVKDKDPFTGEECLVPVKFPPPLPDGMTEEERAAIDWWWRDCQAAYSSSAYYIKEFGKDSDNGAWHTLFKLLESGKITEAHLGIGL